ncbi:hypothetical protein JYU34_005045 [Plutella xylostella]|uniref:Uncharacterized protein n=1 Tax=Plutella xylostella TaxID=51655 RepID=A0ABQ7QVQ8_PLUXY|nr:hypothetical protein JYU34_005045 [Plutella xylostella]
MDKIEQLKLLFITTSMAAGLAYSYGLFDKPEYRGKPHQTNAGRNHADEEPKDQARTQQNHLKNSTDKC